MKRARNETVEKVKTACSSVWRPPVEHARGKPCFGKRYGGAGGPAGIAAPDGRPPDGMAAALPLPSADGPQLSRLRNHPDAGSPFIRRRGRGVFPESLFLFAHGFGRGGAVVVFPPDVFKRMASRPPPWGNAVLGGSPDPVSAVRRGAQHARGITCIFIDVMLKDFTKRG